VSERAVEQGTVQAVHEVQPCRKMGGMCSCLVRHGKRRLGQCHDLRCGRSGTPCLAHQLSAPGCCVARFYRPVRRPRLLRGNAACCPQWPR
jgi:hypothetical protein